MWETRSKLIFGSCMLIAGLMFFQMGMYTMHALAGWEVKYNVIQFCHTAIRSLGVTWAGYMLNAIVFHTLLLAVWSAGKQLYLSRAFHGKLRLYRHEALTRQICEQYGGGSAPLTVIRGSAPMAFAAGVWKPQIVLSTGLLELLDPSELAAVIHHETFHRKHGDPLKIFLLSLLASVMWYMPILKSFHHNYKIVREILADNYAIDKLGGSADLGGALLKLLKGQAPVNLPIPHVSFTDTSINFRIRKLLEPHGELPLKWPFTPAMISVQAMLALCSMFIVAMH
ncbi:M56 family metallopeptidase [Paenibacillus doosanensis]|uniref:M56 family metallopeptidase n=1 Tax=Paenibacillus doosanensis TaxID=1229154 RepID=UPI00217FFC62|nr:M56 family metallopeptidase [Paenibacillus doosanensis]MCS7460912.1 M56 family metallopeptidase [Paenibacillus doosanensis]